jgi:hypothetical protein
LRQETTGRVTPFPGAPEFPWFRLLAAGRGPQVPGALVLLTTVVILVFLVVLCGLSLACIELGRRIGRARVIRLGDQALEGFSAVEGGVFALLGLLLAFSFSAAAARFDARRDLIVREANAIDVAYRRVDLLPPAAQPPLRVLFGQYVDARLAVFDAVAHFRFPRQEEARVAALQSEIWSRAVEAVRKDDYPGATMVVLPAMNDVFDIANTRDIAMRAHLPALVMVLLVLLTLAGSVLAGYGMARTRSRSWGHILAFAAIMAVTVYVILDYEFPRFGLIRIEWVDQTLIDLRQTMP